MREKKVRGMKRKTNSMIAKIEEMTANFPTEFYNYYWHMHLPVSQSFINSNKTPNKVKQLCIQKLLNRAEYLTQLKPNDNEKYRIVVAVNLPYLWDSQIIIFKGDSYFQEFFNRNNEYQKWSPLSDNRNIQTEWNLSIPNGLQVSGFKEIIAVEDGQHYESEIWFIGEILT